MRGGGVAILTRNHLRVTRIELGGSDSSLESLWLSVTGPGRRTVVVGAIYRPPAAPAARGLELIQEQFQSAAATCKPVIVLGDFNINMLETEAPNTRRLSTVLNDLGLRQLVKQATHLSRLLPYWIWPSPTCPIHRWPQGYSPSRSPIT